MKILVLGAGGFIGSHLVTRLVSQGHQVHGIDIKLPEFEPSQATEFHLGDLTEYNTFELIKGIKFDEIYQLAADMGGALYIFTGDNDSTIMSNNVQINLNLLRFLRQTKQNPHVFYSSSACIYPLHNQLDSANPNCSEDSAYPANPDSEYGWEKLYSERLFLTQAKNYGTPVRIARYHNIYGPQGTWQGGREKSPAAICRKVITATNSIEIIGSGQQTRSFLYIDDCIDATIQLTRSEVNFPINIGSEEMVSIDQLVDIASAIEGKKLTKVHIDGPLGVPGRNSDNKLIEEYLHWKPKYTLAQGLTTTYQWIQSQINLKNNQIVLTLPK